MQAPTTRPNCDCLGCIGIARLRVPFFAARSCDGAVRSVGRGNRSILVGRQKWGRSTGANVSEARRNSNELRAGREARSGRSVEERVLSSVVRSSTANAAEQCWHGKSAQRSSSERETETDRESTARKTTLGNPSRGNIWAIEPDRVAGVAEDSYRASSSVSQQERRDLCACAVAAVLWLLCCAALCRAVGEERGRRTVGLGN